MLLPGTREWAPLSFDLGVLAESAAERTMRTIYNELVLRHEDDPYPTRVSVNPVHCGGRAAFDRGKTNCDDSTGPRPPVLPQKLVHFVVQRQHILARCSGWQFECPAIVASNCLTARLRSLRCRTNSQSHCQCNASHRPSPDPYAGTLTSNAAGSDVERQQNAYCDRNPCPSNGHPGHLRVNRPPVLPLAPHPHAYVRACRKRGNAHHEQHAVHCAAGPNNGDDCRREQAQTC